ncbi:acyl-CoA dehydrogenase family protein [Actinocorallia aurea]
MKRDLFDDDHETFRETVAAYLDREMVPHAERWARDGVIDRAAMTAAGRAGLLGIAAPAEHGGGGTADFRHNLVITEEIQRRGLAGAGMAITLHNDVALPYLLKLATPAQLGRWMPGVCSGELILALAMTEPGAGSDVASLTTTATRDGDHYVVNGAKTFITNGLNGDLVITAVKTDPSRRHDGVSLLVLERGMPGFERGRKLHKIGQHAQDTAELHFTDVRVPVANLLGEEGRGFGYMMGGLAQERLSIAMTATAACAAAFGWTLDYVKERTAFGRPVADFQHTRFVLAELATELEIGQTFVDRCVLELNAGTLTAERAAKAKWWCTELQKRLVDQCLQLHGGYGYMLEYPIARAYQDARITTIYGGTTEIMKEIIGKSLVRGGAGANAAKSAR